MSARMVDANLLRTVSSMISSSCSIRTAALTMCVLCACAVGGLHVQAADEPDEDSADRATYKRLVWEEGVESRPIEGATVVLRHVVGGPGTEKVVETTTHKTNEQGAYSFSVSKKHAADPTFSIAVNLSHPRYDACLPHLDGGLFPLKLYEDEVHTGPRRVLEMRPCDEVTGIIQDVNRKAVADAEVTGYSYRDGPDSYREVKTDRQGRFRFNILRGGHVFVVAIYKGYAPTVHRLGKKSGDVGPLMLEAGKAVTGVVLKSDGTPLEGAWVVAKTGGELSLHDPIVPPLIHSSAKTDAKGRFELSLTNGLYTIGVYPLEKPWEFYPREKPWSVPRPNPLPAVFHPALRKLTVTKTKPTSLEFRAVPHVAVEVKCVDSADKPSRRIRLLLSGAVGIGGFMAESSPDTTGVVSFLVPRGLVEARLDLLAHPQTAVAWRRGSTESWSYQRAIELETVNEDVNDIELKIMASPVLIFRPVDALGGRLPTLPKLKYKVDRLKPAPEGLSKPGDTDVYFDGRRSENLVPGVPFSLTVTDTNYEMAPQELVLSEGEEKHLEVRLTKKPK